MPTSESEPKIDSADGAAAGGVRLAGVCLHSGDSCEVTLRPRTGPLVFRQALRTAELAALRVSRTDLGVTVEDGGGLSLDLVEHLLAAFGGLRIYEGIEVEVGGRELPLLDGGATQWSAALLDLAVPTAIPPVRIQRAWEFRDGDSHYRFYPSRSSTLEVSVCFAHPLIGTQHCSWEGDRHDFLQRLAPCRTFGFAASWQQLQQKGRARGADPDNLLIYLEDRVHPACRPPVENEVAGHKLLDLIGDLAFYGGPPLGHIEATRPGHTATHRALRTAMSQGIVVPA